MRLLPIFEVGLKVIGEILPQGENHQELTYSSFKEKRAKKCKHMSIKYYHSGGPGACP